MASKYPYYGAVHSLVGTALVTGYTDSATVINPTVANRIRFYVRAVLTAGSAITTVTIKARHRLNDPFSGVTLPYVDLPTTSDAAPAVLAIGTALTVVANATTDASLYLDVPKGVSDLIVSMKVNLAGQTTDVVTVYAVAG